MILRYCGNTIPAPIITDESAKQVKIVFYSDNVNYAQGFNINYNYVRIPGNFKLFFYVFFE
jgi:hypothetical protein